MAALKEENFPRGGSNVIGEKRRHATKEDKDLFKTKVQPDEPKAKRRKKDVLYTKAGKKVKTSSERQMLSFNPDHINTLTYQRAIIGLQVLGSVKEVSKFHLVLSLSNGIEGRVPITAISDSYTQLLHKLAEGDSSCAEEVRSLGELFRVGMLLRCLVTEVTRNKKGRHELKLSINPRDVNKNLQPSSLKSGVILTGCVSSCEDHGYVVDVGVAGVLAFLSSTKAEEYIQDFNDGESLSVGSYLHCMVESSDHMEIALTEGRTVSVCVNPRIVSSSLVTQSMGIKLQTLLPGMKFKANVNKVFDHGVTVQFLNYRGSIHQRHLMKSSLKLEQGQKLDACILYIEPTSKLIGLSCQPHLVSPHLAPKDIFKDFDVGQIVEKAKVVVADVKLGLTLKVGAKMKAHAPKSQLSDSKITDIKRAYPETSVHRCRIYDFDYIDRMLMVTLKESHLSQQFMKYSDIQPGILTKGEVLAIGQKGVIVKVSQNITGFIPTLHLADVPLKKVEKHYTVGKEVQCRVLSVDPVEKKMKLTAKKSIVTSPLPALTDTQQAVPGLIVDGVILSIRNIGVIVGFYNGVKGLVWKNELGEEFIEFPEKAFYVGQVVRARVLHFNTERGNLFLSFKLTGKVDNKPKKLPKGCKIGTLIKVKVTGKSEKGLDVHLLPSEREAFLPKHHLSDHLASVDLLLDTYKKGDVIEDCTCYSMTSGILVTRKPILTKAAEEGTLFQKFSALKVGVIRPGIVHRVMDYGIFVEMFGGQGSGLVPNRKLCDVSIPTPGNLFTKGQSVLAKVIEVQDEKHQSTLSLRMGDCHHGDTTVGIDILEENLNEMDTVVETFRKGKGERAKLAAYHVGQIVTVTVTMVTEEGLLCKLPGGVNGVVTSDHTPSTGCEVGQEMEAVVLYVDFKTKCVELAVNEKLVRVVKGFSNRGDNQARVGQDIKSEVLLIKDSHILVSLRGHANGCLAYLPAQQHLNDMLETRKYEVTQMNRVIIKRVVKGKVLASLKIHEVRMKNDLGKGHQLCVPDHNLKLGMVYEAVLKVVRPFLLEIDVDQFPGQVHVSEIADDIKDGRNPLKAFKVGQQLRVKVVGFRDAKSHNVLPETHEDHSKSIPVFSLKASRMKSKKTPEMSISYEKGDKVQAFVQSYKDNQLWMIIAPYVHGRVPILKISENLTMLSNVTKHFKQGQCYNATVTGKQVGGTVPLSLLDDKIEIKPGVITTGRVEATTLTDVTVGLADGSHGQVDVTDIADKYSDRPTTSFQKDQFVKCAVLSCTGKIQLSLRQSRVQPTKQAEIDDPECTLSDLQPDSLVRGYVCAVSTTGVFVKLGRDVRGCIKPSHLSKYQISDIRAVFLRGMVVRAKVMSLDKMKEKVDLSLLEEHTGEPEQLTEEQIKLSTEENKTNSPKRKISVDDAETTSKKKKLERKKKKKKKQAGSDEESEDSGDEDDDVDDTMTSVPRLSVTEGFKWGESFSMPALSDSKQDSDSDDSEDDDEMSKSKKPGVQRSRQEKLAVLREEERSLVKKEHRLMDADRELDTVDDFDRLVLQSPDSSLVWLRYMAFHLETAEIEKARAVAERALKTISFREEQEKLNVWVGYLNLENMYGTQASLTEVFERALKLNEPVKVYNQLLNIYDTSGKEEAAEQLHTTVVRRFKTDKDVWINFGLFYFKHEKLDSARKLMQRSLKSLDKMHHVEVLSKFAQLEFKYGEPERGKTMFENILGSYPRRTDLWSVYLDMVIKVGDMDKVRDLFERVIHMDMSAKKMKFFFKKYLDFEEKHGTEESANMVKQKALAYVEAQTTA